MSFTFIKRKKNNFAENIHNLQSSKKDFIDYIFRFTNFNKLIEKSKFHSLNY